MSGLLSAGPLYNSPSKNENRKEEYHGVCQVDTLIDEHLPEEYFFSHLKIRINKHTKNNIKVSPRFPNSLRFR